MSKYGQSVMQLCQHCGAQNYYCGCKIERYYITHELKQVIKSKNWFQVGILYGRLCQTGEWFDETGHFI